RDDRGDDTRAAREERRPLHGGPRVGLRDAQHHRGVTPQALEPIEVPLVGDERVHDHVPEIDEDPPPRRVAFDTKRLATGLLRFLPDRIGDGLDLTLAAARADDEEVGDGRELRDVQYEDVLGFLVARRLDDDVRQRTRGQLGHRYSWCRVMYRSAASTTRYRSDRPRAARARSSRELMSRSGASSERATGPSFLSGEWRAGTKMTRSSGRSSSAAFAIARWPTWTGSKVPPKTPTRVIRQPRLRAIRARGCRRGPCHLPSRRGPGA